PDVAFALLDHAVNSGESEPSSLPFFLGGEEGLEDVLLQLSVHATAVVDHANQNVVAGNDVAEALFIGIGELRVFGFDAQQPALRHSVARIHGEIQQHLLDLAAIGFHAAKTAPERNLQLDIFADKAAQHFFDVAQDGIGIENLGLEHLL